MIFSRLPDFLAVLWYIVGGYLLFGFVIALGDLAYVPQGESQSWFQLFLRLRICRGPGIPVLLVALIPALRWWLRK